MLKMRVLTTVSAMALATSVGATAAKANNLVVDLTAASPTLTVAAGSSSVDIANEQLTSGASQTADVVNAAIGFPGGDPSVFQDVGGGTVTVQVSDVDAALEGTANSIFAEAGSNEATNQIDFYTATGSGDSSAATLGSFQVSADSDVVASTDNTNVLAQVLDLGAGSTVQVEDNDIRADGTINSADNLIYGDVNNALTSTELGQATIDAGSGTVTAGATALAGNAQAVIGGADSSATVSDSRIGVLAQVGGVAPQPSIDGAPIDLTNNAITASFTGNDASTTVALTGDQDITLDGTAGVVNSQVAGGDYSFDAETDSVAIEAANTQDLVGPGYMADLTDTGLTVQDNEIMATSTANDAENGVSLDENVNLTGVPSARLNSVDIATDTANVNGDLFIANAQYSAVDTNADVDEGEVNVLTGDALGATIIADDNTIGAEATGSAVVNQLDVGNTADFSALVAVNTVQYTEGATQTASNDSQLVLDTGSTSGTGLDVDDSSLTVDDNALYAEAMGNSHSSAVNITGTTVTGAGTLVTNSILADRPSTAGQVSADFSLLNVQVVDGGGVNADVVTEIDVDAGDDSFTTSDLSVSGNDIRGLAVGNLSTEASIAVDATTFTGTVGVANVQTVEDGASLTSSIAPQDGALITADVAADESSVTDEAGIHVDANTASSRVWGNLADATTNSIAVDAVTVESGPNPLRSAVSTNRIAGVSYTAVDHTISLLNDQSVEDLDGALVSASATGDFINLTVGETGDDALLTNSTVTASGNEGTTSATLNQATSEVIVDAVTLDNAAGLVNVQTLADENNNGESASIDVSQTDLDITVDVLAGGDGDMEDVTVQANDNALLASGRINQASNTLDVSSQTQTLTDTINPAIPTVAPITGTTSIALSSGATYGDSESLLINDQSFEALGTGAGPGTLDGMAVVVFDNDITVDVGTDEDLLNSVAEVNGNSVTALALGNDATNTLMLDVDSFDTTNANQDAGPTNGPIASIGSQQTGTAGDGSGAIAATVDSTTISLDADADDTDNIAGSDLSIDENSVRALSRTNNVSNDLTASGNTVLNDVFETPLSSISGADGLVLLDETTFAVGSRQVSSVSNIATVVGTAISVEAGSAVTASEIDSLIDDTSISANSNLVVAEARGSDAGNSLSTDFVENAAQSSVANSQTADGPVTYSASAEDTEITVLTDVGETVTDSAFTANGNAVAALASGNRATNALSADGTNVRMSNGMNVTSVDPVLGSLSSDASLAVLNVQGDPASLGGAPVGVDATVADAIIGVGANGLFDSGSVSAEANLVLAQAVSHSATNSLEITASANIESGGLDSTPGASIGSLQTVSAGSQVQSQVSDVTIAAIVDDQRSTLSMAASVTDNQVLSSAIGGSATNALLADAEAGIQNGQISNPSVGEAFGPAATTLDAGFNVLNVQRGAEVGFTSSIDGVDIAAGGAEDYNADSAVVGDNVVQAEARGFIASNSLTLDAGSSSTATGAIANNQALNGGVITTINDVVIATGNLDEGAVDSSLSVGGNTVQALSSGNQAQNVLNTTADASLQENSGAGTEIDPADPTPLNVSGADYAVLNNQTMGGTVSATVTQVAIGIDGLEAVTGVNDSALDVEGNQVRASAVGNDAVNSMVLNTGTFAHPSAAVANLQRNNGTSVSATVDGAAIGIGGVGTTIGATSDGSSFSVRGNSIGASAIGNRAVNSLASGD
jgi:hypothetical protein